MVVRRILVGTDFTPGARAAIEAAARLAADCSASLVIAHALHVVGSDEEELEDQLGDARDALELDAATARSITPNAQTRLVVSSSSSAFLELLEVEAFDLVVVGAHEGSRVSAFFLGSVAEKVLRHAPCSVLVVRGARRGSYRHVLCATDFSRAARIAHAYAEDLAEPAARIDLVHALELPLVVGEEPRIAPVVALERDARHELAESASRFEAKGHPGVALLRFGSPAREITALAASDPTYDLVIVGSHGRTGLRRALLGSVAERVARHAPCSVFIARSAGESARTL